MKGFQLTIENERVLIESENIYLESERILIESERILIENERILIENERIFIANERILIENERNLIGQSQPEPARASKKINLRTPEISKNQKIEEKLVQNIGILIGNSISNHFFSIFWRSKINSKYLVFNREFNFFSFQNVSIFWKKKIEFPIEN